LAITPRGAARGECDGESKSKSKGSSENDCRPENPARNSQAACDENPLLDIQRQGDF
jgi:hypothetical protein